MSLTDRDIVLFARDADGVFGGEASAASSSTSAQDKAMTKKYISGKAVDLSERIAVLERALRPFAEMAHRFEFAIGPDGYDDGLTVTASVDCRPEHEAVLSTLDFSNARRVYGKGSTGDLSAGDELAEPHALVRALHMIDALPMHLRPSDEAPLRDNLPGCWPTVGDLRSLIAQLA